MVSIGEAVLLGILQGITEFLPVSSSGHLVMMKNIFGLKEPDLFFDTMVHAGTLMAVLVVFRKDLLKLIGSFFTLIPRIISPNQLKDSFANDTEARLIGFIVLAVIPAGLAGFFLKDLFELLFSSVLAVGISFVVTGTLLLLTKFIPQPQKTLKKMTIGDSLIIGLAQALAITPGISRSGATISAALFLGIDREPAGRFSFLIFIPAILGALLLNFELPEEQSLSYLGNIGAAAITAGLTGYFALRILLRFVKQGRLYMFAPYLYVVGLAAVLFTFFK